ncbi:NAD(P)-binding domain-containing protein [uncultured Proteiniphilum sp.]|uniref:NAD(P)-binding domain-containing protein n=1 Tax=uncultured Proteiniphilum sp. TaxID=497637 RepID=UPI00261CC031|nr:NAD(P)-binding domain-containing protein [uncultured Proteiniphilum sp.]
MNNQSKPSKPKAGIIGIGRIGQALAGNFIKSGRSFNATDINTELLNELSGQWGETGKAGDLPTTIRDSDILILSIWFEGIREFLKEHAGKLNGKIIIDPSNPIMINGTGTFKKLIAENESSGEVHKTFMPEGTKIAKVLFPEFCLSLCGSVQNTGKRGPALCQ